MKSPLRPPGFTLLVNRYNYWMRRARTEYQRHPIAFSNRCPNCLEVEGDTECRKCRARGFTSPKN